MGRGEFVGNRYRPERHRQSRVRRGGNLAAAVCLRAKAEKGPEIAFQLLIYPVTDAPRGTQSYKDFAEGYFLEAEGMDWFWNHYVLAAGADPKNPYAAPLHADSFSGLPPAYVVTAGFDVLRDEGKAYAEALKKAGVDVEYVNYEGMIHGFFNLQGALDVSRDAVEGGGEGVASTLRVGHDAVHEFTQRGARHERRLFLRASRRRRGTCRSSPARPAARRRWRPRHRFRDRRPPSAFPPARTPCRAPP